MSAKEIKTRLKEAREAIRLKDFDAAAAHCKAILDQEKNYNALVFLGVAYEGLNQVDHALDAYKKATSECPDQPLAWQGISSMLDKNSHLLLVQGRIEVFEKLQSFLTGNEGKRVFYLHKLVLLYMEAKNEEKAYSIVQELLELEKEGDGRMESCKAMVDLLNSQVISQDEAKCHQCFKSLKELLDCSSLTDDDINRYTRLMLFHKSMINDDSSQFWEDLRCKFPSAIPPLEFGLHFHLDQTIGHSSITNTTVEVVTDLSKCLEKVDPDNDMAKAAHGFMAWNQRNYVKAKECLIGITPNIVSALYYLSNAYLNLHDLSSCLKTCGKGLQICGENQSIAGCKVGEREDMFRLLQAEAHRQMGSEDDQAKALTILEQMEDRQRDDALVIKSYLYLDQGKFEHAQNLIQSLQPDGSQVKLLTAIHAMAHKQHTKALALFDAVLKEEPENSVATLKKGIALWMLKDTTEVENAKQQCFTVLLKAAKLDPYNFESFLYLGYFYEQVQKDLIKATRCYRKSYDLNPTSEEAGCAFVDSLSDQQDQSQALDILKAVTSRAPPGKAKWAWLRLGLYQMKHEDPSSAITSLQSALRADPKDNHVWECLSEAYLHRGSLTAALKAFTKASELNPESTYCLYQIANIKQTLGLLSEAVKEYHNVLVREPNYVAALKGLGESMIQLAKQNLHQCLDGLAQDNIQEALAILTRAASQRPDFSCLWKLMGDSCTLVSCLASNSYRIPSKLLEKNVESHSVTEVTKEGMLQTGGRCYSQAIKIMPENASLWHNLGVNLYRQCCLKHQEMNQESAKEFIHRARRSLENALKLDPKNWRHWNALGVIASCKVDYKPTFAQHCFIKSVESEASNVVAWSNLGVLYLSEGNIKLAHDSFKVAQRLDPTYLVGWLGQALVAETVGHEEAMDLFRHTTELGAHLESQLGYGHQVLSILRDETKQNTQLFQFCIHRMAAIPAASDALIKYTARVPTDPTAFNMLGLLLEHQRLIQPSVDAFERALSLLEGNSQSGMETQVRMNYARVLCSLGQCEKSLQQFEKIGSDLTLEHLFMYALAAYKHGQYIDSFKLYKLALDQVGDDEELKSQVYAALAMVAFKVDDLDEAKTQLFNGFQTESPCLQGILAMCALGLNQGDMTLATAALEELAKRPDKNKVIDKIAFLTLYKHVLEETVPEGEPWLQELIQSNPKHARKLQSVLASFLINNFPDRGLDAVCCVRTVDGIMNLPETVTKTLAELQTGLHNDYDKDKNAFKSAQRAFHLNPGDLSAIVSMATAAHAEGVLRKLSASDHSTLFGMEKGLLELLDNIITESNNVRLQIWYVQQLVMCYVELGNESEAQEKLKLLEEFQGSSTFVEALTLFLYATPIDEWGKKENLLSIMVVCVMLSEEENDVSVIEMLKKIVNSPVGDQSSKLPMVNLLELWTHTAFNEIQKKRLKGSPELESLFGEGIFLADKNEMKSPVLSVMKGVRMFKSSKKDAKHHFATALDQSEGRSDQSTCRSVARQGLLSLLWDSTKDSDIQLFQALVNDAKADDDVQTVKLYDKFFRS